MMCFWGAFVTFTVELAALIESGIRRNKAEGRSNASNFFLGTAAFLLLGEFNL